ncbi:MAG: hypothetical protein AAGG57_04530 [Pseudomonadota bacterium]
MIDAALMTFVSLLALMLFPVIFVIGAGIGVLFRRYWWAFGVAAVLGAGIMLLLPFRFITDEMTLARQVAMDSVACALVCLVVQGVARRLLTREAA